MNIYAESSFLASCYIPDANSVAALRTLGAGGGILLVTALTELEVVNAFEIRVFRREVSREEAGLALSNFQSDLRHGMFQFRGVPEPAFGRARELSRQTTAGTGTRAADLLHIAAALELGADHLFSFDEKQRNLARAVHLKLN